MYALSSLLGQKVGHSDSGSAMAAVELLEGIKAAEKSSYCVSDKAASF
jgi:hypothetical protein